MTYGSYKLFNTNIDITTILMMEIMEIVYSKELYDKDIPYEKYRTPSKSKKSNLLTITQKKSRPMCYAMGILSSIFLLA